MVETLGAGRYRVKMDQDEYQIGLSGAGGTLVLAEGDHLATVRTARHPGMITVFLDGRAIGFS